MLMDYGVDICAGGCLATVQKKTSADFHHNINQYSFGPDFYWGHYELFRDPMDDPTNPPPVVNHGVQFVAQIIP